MSQHRKPLDIQETSQLVPAGLSGGAYSFVKARPSRKQAVIVDLPPELEFDDDVPTRDIRPLLARGTPPFGTPLAAIEVLPDILPEALRPTIELPAPPPAEDLRPTVELPKRATAYHDPDLCACAKMLSALAGGIVMVVVEGPVTLSPAVLRERTLLSGDFNLDAIERAYDGKAWAFRYCPFEGRLIDDQVAVRTQVENMTCCGTMHEAVLHGRVELPDPSRHDRGLGMFTDPGRPSAAFTHCPWCATEIIDLVIARHKRHLGL